MDKSTVRRIILNKRSEYDNDYILEKSNIFSQKFFNEIDFNNIDTVHIYLSIDKEIDTWNIIDYIFNNYKTKVVIPKVNGFNLEHCYLNEDTKLTKNKFGIYEPVEGDLYEGDCFDLIVVPLLAVDEEGYRVGYGGGYYDRFLSEYSGFKIGLSLEDPIEFEVEEHDIKLDKCIFSK